MKNKINKEDYLRLLDAVIKEQQLEDIEVNKEYLEDKERVAPKRFLYVESQKTIHATDMNRQEIDNAWTNQGNIIVGDFLLKISGFVVDSKTESVPYITFNLYDYEKDEKGKVTATKIDTHKDIRFSNVNWKSCADKIRIHAPLPIVLDIIEWLQKLDKLGAFV